MPQIIHVGVPFLINFCIAYLGLFSQNSAIYFYSQLKNTFFHSNKDT